jgi:hypothetical protein
VGLAIPTLANRIASFLNFVVEIQH